MKTKLVLWGKNSEEAKVLMALQLLPKENSVKTWIFEEEHASDELHQKLLKEWRDNKEVEFPEAKLLESELTASGGLVPEGITVEKEDIVQRAQTEWHFIVLSSKLHQAYENEVAELRDKINGLTAYSHEAWNELKIFWDKVREQMRDRNLFREHGDMLRNQTNELFTKMKAMRATMDAEFLDVAKANHAKFAARLDEIEGRITQNTGLYNIFEELKAIQREFKTTKLTRDLRSEIWERLDSTFKKVKEIRFGGHSDRLSRRSEGLTNAISKMEDSIRRDEKDLEFQNRKINSVNAGQLETQIRQAKLKMIEERLNSKKSKLAEMYKTMKELNTKQKEEAKKAKATEAAAKKAEEAKAAEVVETPAPVEEVAEEKPKAEEKSTEETTSTEEKE